MFKSIFDWSKLHNKMCAGNFDVNVFKMVIGYGKRITIDMCSHVRRIMRNCDEI